MDEVRDSVQEAGIKTIPKNVNVNVKLLSRVQLFATPGTAAPQAPLPTEFSRQEYRSELPFSSPEDLPDCVSCIARQILYH